MTLDQLLDTMVLSDGKILDVTFSQAEGTASCKLLVRRADNLSQSVLVSLGFFGAIEVRFFCDNSDVYTGDYSDIVLCCRSDGRYYLSLDPYGNSGEPSDFDNDVIVADEIRIAV